MTRTYRRRPTAGRLALVLALVFALAQAATPALAAPPPNDQSGGATLIPGAGPFPHLTPVTADITDASTTGDPSHSCAATVSRSIWYTFTPTADGNYTFSTLSGPTDTTVDNTVLAIYTLVGNAFVESGCDNDISGSLQAELSIDLTGGLQYWIVVWQFGAAAPAPGHTAVQLQTRRNTVPANDTGAGAIALALDTPLDGTTVAAANDYQLSGSACFPSFGQTPSTATGRDVVYKFTAPTVGAYSFRVTGYSSLNNPVLYVASMYPTDPPPQTVTTCLSAANRQANGSAEEVAGLQLTAGQLVYIFVDENTSTPAGSTFTIEVNRPLRESASNDTPATASALACGAEGAITPAGDVDFYSLGTHQDSRVFALADGIASTTTDFDMRVTTAVDTLEYDDDNNDVRYGGLATNVAGTPLTGASAFIRMNLSPIAPATQSEPYRLYAVVQPPIAAATAEQEPNGLIENANSAANNYVAGALSDAADSDVFAFGARAGDLVYLGLDADPLRNGTPIGGIQYAGKLELLGTSGAPLVAVNDLNATSSTASGAGSLTATTPYAPGEGLVYRIRAGGTYYARVTGEAAGDYLLSIALNCAAGALPLITEQPHSQTVVLGQPFTLSVVAAGAGLSYQWRADGLPIFDANASTYQVAAATADDVGSYDVVVSNAFGSVTSAVATITIQTPPAFTNGPPPPATLGAPYSFTFHATGTPAPTFSLTAGALPPGLTLAPNGLLSGTPTAAGAYPNITVTASNGVPPAATQTFSMTIAKITPTITWPSPAAITYGTPLGPAQLNATASVPGLFAYDPPAGTVLGAGSGQTLSATFTPTDTTNYTTAIASVSISVGRAPLVASTDDITRTYGAGAPPLTVSYTGFVHGDTAETALTGRPSCHSAAAPTSDAGAYPIHCTIGTLAAANYSITGFADGTLTIVPAPLTIRANDKVKTANHPTPPLTASYTGFVNGDSPASLDSPVTLTTTAALGSPPGAYAIVPSGASDGNYTIAFVSGTLTVTDKLVPSITWTAPATITYGTALGPAQLSATADVSGTFSYTPPAGTVLDAGNTQPLAALFTPVDPATYAAVPADASIDVRPAPLRITAEDKIRTPSAPDPPFTARYAGLRNGDTPDSLEAPAVLTTTATIDSPAGSYPIVVGGAWDRNYTISYVNGTLTITTKPFRIYLPLVTRSSLGAPATSRPYAISPLPPRRV